MAIGHYGVWRRQRVYQLSPCDSRYPVHPWNSEIEETGSIWTISRNFEVTIFQTTNCYDWLYKHVLETILCYIFMRSHLVCRISCSVYNWNTNMLQNITIISFLESWRIISALLFLHKILNGATNCPNILVLLGFYVLEGVHSSLSLFTEHYMVRLDILYGKFKMISRMSMFGDELFDNIDFTLQYVE